MITLVILKNPFNQDKEIRKINHIPGQSVFAYVQPEMMGQDEIVISRNGCIVPEDEYHSLVPVSGDFIAVCPVIEGEGGGKDFARAIASIAVTVLAFWAGGAIAAGSTWGFWSYVAAASIRTAGGWLINQWFPYEQEKQDQTYGWGQRSPITTEGNAVPITFGTVRMGVMAPIQILSQRVTTSGDKNHLNLLMSGGEEVDVIDGIKINDQPVENYLKVEMHKRYGTNDQTVIPGFDDTWEEAVVGVEMTESAGWITRQTLGNAGSGLELAFTFPSGLYYRKDNGKLLAEWVRIQAQYCKVGDTEWKEWTSNTSLLSLPVSSVSGSSFSVFTGFSASDALRKELRIKIIHDGSTTDAEIVSAVYNQDDGTTTITVDVEVPLTTTKMEMRCINIDRKKNSPFSFVTRLDQDQSYAGKYEVSCKIIKEGTGDKRINTVYWATLTHIIYDDFTRPGKSLLAIRALATDQLSGSLRVSWSQTRSKVWVWNPYTVQYEQKNANNPAWACYDLIHRCKYLKNTNTGLYEYVVKGVKAERIDYQSIADWAAYCDERELYFNGIIYQTSNMWDALKPIEAAGRGKALLRGTRYSCTCDAPSQPVQMFNVANIALDSFKEEFLGQSDRANALEITFYNIDKDYQEDMIVVYGDDYDEETAIQNPAQIRVPYAMTLAQAYRAGKYQLRLNQYLIRCVSWEADIDAIACQVGDVVLVQHDVPQWGIGGRIVTAAANTVTLDQEVTLEAGKEYAVLVRFADDTLVEKTVQSVAETTTTDTLTVTKPYTTIPQPDGIFSFGEIEKVAKPFRLTHLSRDGDLRRKLVALEYNEAVYNEATDIPVVDYTPPVSAITNIEVNEYQDALNTLYLGISWTPPKSGYGGARIIVNGEQIARTESHQTSYEHAIDNAEAGEELTITIEALNDLGLVIATANTLYTVQGAVDLPPAASTGLAYNWDVQDLKVWWNAVVTNSNGLYTEDIKDYQIEVWVGGVKKRTEYVAGNLYTYSLPKNLLDNTNPATSVQIQIYTRDYAEQLSEVAIIDCTCPLPTAPMMTAVDAVARISLSCSITNAQAQKYQKIQIKASQTAGFNPDTDGTTIHDNPSPVYEHTVDTGSTWYYRARIVDKLGQYSSWSAQVSATAHKVDESDMQAQILRMETTSEIAPTAGTLANVHDGSTASSATFGAATWIEDKFVGEQIFSTFRINVKESVDFYVRYFREETQAWNNCLGSAASPKSAVAGKNVFQISPFVQARRIRVYLLGACTVYELRFGTVGQADDFYFEKMKGDQIEAKSIKLGEHLESAPIPLSIQPTDTLFRFDGSLLSTQGEKPLGME